MVAVGVTPAIREAVEQARDMLGPRGAGGIGPVTVREVLDVLNGALGDAATEVLNFETATGTDLNDCAEKIGLRRRSDVYLAPGNRRVEADAELRQRIRNCVNLKPWLDPAVGVVLLNQLAIMDALQLLLPGFHGARLEQAQNATKEFISLAKVR